MIAPASHSGKGSVSHPLRSATASATMETMPAMTLTTSRSDAVRIATCGSIPTSARDRKKLRPSPTSDGNSPVTPVISANVPTSCNDM